MRRGLRLIAAPQSESRTNLRAGFALALDITSAVLPYAWMQKKNTESSLLDSSPLADCGN